MTKIKSFKASFLDLVVKDVNNWLKKNDDKNNKLFAKYQELAKKESNVIFGGRLGNYKYYDMDKVIRAALDKVKIC